MRKKTCKSPAQETEGGKKNKTPNRKKKKRKNVKLGPHMCVYMCTHAQTHTDTCVVCTDWIRVCEARQGNKQQKQRFRAALEPLSVL